ncbi:hypothetical protein WJX73_002780 [Symbiochloris irregularis]|uniref:separase n=1 Tax=Symbiochloris irregularis TaxID=706552 RepID=A0AAW1NV42_9CHLO
MQAAGPADWSRHAVQRGRAVAASLAQTCMQAGCPWLAAGLLHASLGASLRLQHAAVCQSKALRPAPDASQDPVSMAAVEALLQQATMIDAVRHLADDCHPSNLELAEREAMQLLGAALAALPPGTVDLAATNSDLPTCTQAMLTEFEAIMADSANSMEGVKAASTSGDSQGGDEEAGRRMSWWRQRLHLDQRMAVLLRDLDNRALGPWRCLLLGNPHHADLQAAADAAAQLVLGHATAADDAQSLALLRQLMGVLFCSLPRLSVQELQTALQDVLTWAGKVIDEDAVAELAQQLRAKFSDAVHLQSEACSPGVPGAGVSLPDVVMETPEPVETLLAGHTEGLQRQGRGARRGRSNAQAAAADRHANASVADQPVQSQATSTPAAMTTRRSAATTGRRRGVLSRMRPVEGSPPAAEADHAATPPQGPAASRGKPRRGPAAEQTPFVLHRRDDPDVCELSTRMQSLGIRSMGGSAPQADLHSQPSRPAFEEAFQRSPVLLVLDSCLQQLPWESLPRLQGQALSRMPSLACAAATAAASSAGQTNVTGFAENAAGTSAPADAQGTAGRAPLIDPLSAFYLINPSGDLPSTQAAFQQWFQSQPGWQGHVGAPPPEAALVASALTRHQLYIYCGHGAGEQYLPVQKVRRLHKCAAGLLMGCSSGRLHKSGTCEAAGPALAYLLAGAPATVANLWDVTDRDIDRFSPRRHAMPASL